MLMPKINGIDSALALIIKKAKVAEIDYGFIMDCLSNYEDPRGKLGRLIKEGALIAVRKGLYVISSEICRVPYSFEILANLIYGPSYVSLEWALQYYRLIPERVVTVTSITMKRPKKYHTKLGSFTYDHLHPSLYPVGITQLEFAPYHRTLIATKEKALTDLLIVRRGRCSSRKELKEILFEDFRIEAEDLVIMDRDRISMIYQAHPHSAVRYLIEVMGEL